MDIARGTSSCRVWQLRGIPCAHVVATLYFKKLSLYDYIDNCYTKETYLRTSASVIEPLTNLEMSPVSANPTVEPPESKTCLVGHLRLEGKKLEKLRNQGSFLGLNLK